MTNATALRACTLGRPSFVATCCFFFLSTLASDGTLCCALSAGKQSCHVAVIGGGPSGMFAAASLMETLRKHQNDSPPSFDSIQVKVYESTGQVLRTLRRDHRGGILHDTSKKPRELINEGFPRGKKEIMSILTSKFPPLMQQRWFEDRGIEFKTQRDGSMVCVDTEESDGNINAQERICDAILQDCEHVLIKTKAKVIAIANADQRVGGYQLSIQSPSGVRDEHCDVVVLATGNSRLGHGLANTLGLTTAAPVRSCFAFKLSAEGSPALSQLQQGTHYLLPHLRLSFRVKPKGQKRLRLFKSEGPAHIEVASDKNGATIILGGKAALALSSQIPDKLKEVRYEGSLLAHFCPDHFHGKVEHLEEYLWQHRQDNPKEVVGNSCPIHHYYVDYDEYDWETYSFRRIKTNCIPSDLWQGLTQQCGAPRGSLWSQMSPKKVRRLAETIVGCTLNFVGRDSTGTASPYINTGGILLREVDMSTMQSKVRKSLFCCGQVLDGDASQGTFSLMRDFATGKVAGEHVALYAISSFDNLRLKGISSTSERTLVDESAGGEPS